MKGNSVIKTHYLVNKVRSRVIVMDKSICSLNSEFVYLDIREIYSSIFDHKPVVHREVEFFVKEFEVSTFWCIKYFKFCKYVYKCTIMQTLLLF